MNIHITASLKDFAVRGRCEPVIANTVCINAFRKKLISMRGGGGVQKNYFLTYLKTRGCKAFQFSSVIIVANMSQIIIIVQLLL